MRFASVASLLVLSALVLGVLVTSVRAEVYLDERFADGSSWTERWIESSWKKSDGTNGKLKLTAGKYYGDVEADKGVQTSEDARFYTFTTKLAKPVQNDGKPLVFQFTVKNEQHVDCGGMYFKLAPPATNPASFNGDSPYEIMFGPDICGTGTRRTHVILSRNNVNHLVKREVRCETDRLTHLYQLILRPDNSYEVKIDQKTVQSGQIEDDFDLLPPKQIDDPNDTKPADWVDEREIVDPEDKKPEGWDDVPKTISDPDAKKPDDWDDEDDGEWEAPQVPNPEYKGEWKARMIPNPAYKGVWKARRIDNPDYEADDKLYVRSVGTVSLEVWQVKSGSLFDNIAVTDSVEDADAIAEATWGATHDKEKAMFDKQEEERRQREEEDRKRAEEERKKREADEKAKKKSSSDDDDDDDEADDDDDDEDHEDL